MFRMLKALAVVAAIYLGFVVGFATALGVSGANPAMVPDKYRTFVNPGFEVLTFTMNAVSTLLLALHS